MGIKGQSLKNSTIQPALIGISKHKVKAGSRNCTEKLRGSLPREGESKQSTIIGQSYKSYIILSKPLHRNSNTYPRRSLREKKTDTNFLEKTST